jgi:hypothetical protein
VKIKEPLDQRIKELERECRRFVNERAVELARGSGVPSVVLEAQLLTGKSAFEAALAVISTRKRDDEIAKREWLKEHHSESKQPKPAA